MQITPEELHAQRWFDPAEYPFAPAFLDTPAGPIHYVDEGPRGGEAIVFVHGTPSWSHDFRHVIRALSDKRRCIALDHLGFGLSARPADGDYSLEAHTANFARLLEHLDLERYTLVVHDFGGPIALPAAAKSPERVARVVAINSWLWALERVTPALEKRKKLLAGRLMRFLYLRANFSAKQMVKMSWGKHTKLTRRMHDAYRRMFPNVESRLGTWAFARAIATRGDYFDGLCAACAPLGEVPFHIIWGGADKLVTTDNVPLWRESFRVESEHILEPVGHFPQDEAASDVIHLLRGILGATGTNGARRDAA